MILSGWKEIACYLHSGVRTVQRWERNGLPISRPTSVPRGLVLAESKEIDHWLRDSIFRHSLGSSRLLNVERARQLRAEVQCQRIETLRKEMEIVRATAGQLQRGGGYRISKNSSTN